MKHLAAPFYLVVLEVLERFLDDKAEFENLLQHPAPIHIIRRSVVSLNSVWSTSVQPREINRHCHSIAPRLYAGAKVLRCRGIEPPGGALG